MEGDQVFDSKLTPEEIDLEIAKVEDFFKRIPDELKVAAAMHLILEIVNHGSRDYFQAMGIFDEAKNSFRGMAMSIGAMNDEQDLLSAAYESSQHFRCIQELKWAQNCVITPGEIRSVGYVGQDDRYVGGQRYEVFLEDGKHFSICQNIFIEHFEEIGDVN